MLVDINLLPQKEAKKFSFVITISAIVALFLLIGGFYFWQTQSVKQEITSLDSQISMTKKIAEKEQQNTNTVAASSSVNQLKGAIDWANEYPMQTVPVMQHLTSLLPERGFIQSFAYTEAGKVTLTVQFDSAREAAFFLDSLNHSDWIDEASLSSLAAAQTESETTAASNTAAANSQVTTTSQTTNSTQVTTAGTETVDSQNVNTTGTLTNQVTQNTTATANQTSVTNNTTTATTSTTKKSSNFLPRYTGQFEIKFNKEEIKKATKKSTKDGEGVKGS
jgi:Tfp pilus assembly protein PilN